MPNVFDQFDQPAPAANVFDQFDEGAEPPKPAGGLAAAAKQAIGAGIKGAGQLGADYLPGVGRDNAVSAYGQEVIDANPTAINSFSDMAESPWTTVKEAVGNAAALMASMAGARALGMGMTAAAPLTGPAAPFVAGAGQLIANAGPIVAAALPSYGGIRESQIAADPANEADGKSKAVALLGAGAVGYIENKFGPQAWAQAAMKKGGIEAIAKQLADAKSIPGAIGKGILRGGAIEGAEELVQNPIEQVAGYQDPTTRQAIGETLFGGAMGAVGGGVMGGGMGGFAKAMEKQPPAVQQPPATTPAQTAAATTAGAVPPAAQAAAPQTPPAAVVPPAAATPAVDPVNNPAAVLADPNAGVLSRVAATGELTGANEQQRQEQAIAQSAADAATAQAAAKEEQKRAAEAKKAAKAGNVTGLAGAGRQTTGATNEGAQAGSVTAGEGQNVVAAAQGIGGAGATTQAVGQVGGMSGAAADVRADAAGMDRIPAEPIADAAVAPPQDQAVTLPLEQAATTTQPGQPNGNQAEITLPPAQGRPAQPVAPADQVTQAIAAPPDARPAPASVPSLEGRTDQQLAYLSTNGQPGYREAAITEIARRAAMSAENVGETLATGNSSEIPAGAVVPTNEPSKPKKSGWEAFPPESGTLGIPRASMPQIRADHRGAMVNFMNARGVSHQQEEIKASSLRATQAEFSPTKVENAAKFDGGNRSILVSSDNHVLDGHHQWLAKLNAGESLRVIRLGAPIKDLIPLAHEFPSSSVAANPSTIPSGSSNTPEIPDSSPDSASYPVVDNDTKRASASRNISKPAPNMRRDDLVGAIMRVTGGNGIAAKMALTVAGDTSNRLTKLRGLFTGRGTEDLGDVAMLLRTEENFDVRDGEHLSELIRAASAGDVAVNMERQERYADADKEAQWRDRIRKQAKKYGVKSVAVKFSDLESRVLAIMEQRTQKAVAALDTRAQERFEAALAESQKLVPDEDLDAVLTALHDKGMTPLEFWRQATAAMRAMNQEAIAKQRNEAEDEFTSQEPDWFSDDDGQGNQPAGSGGAGNGVDQAPASEGLELTGQTPAELAEAEAERVAAEKAKKAASDKAAADEKAAADRKAIKQASERAADTFELGGNALDNLTGQASIFDGAAAAPKPAESTSEPPMKKGDRFTDGAGNLWEVWMARTGLIEAHPVVDGKPVVNRDSGVRFATTSMARSANPEARTDFTPVAEQYRYALVNRPASMGAVPKVNFTVEARPPAGQPHHDTARHGIMVTDRKLTDEEIKSFELSPIADDAMLDDLAGQVAKEMSEYAAEYIETAKDDRPGFLSMVGQQIDRMTGGVRYSIGDRGALADKVLARLMKASPSEIADAGRFATMRGDLSNEAIASLTDQQLRDTMVAIRDDFYRGMSNRLKDSIRRAERSETLDREAAREVVTAHRDYWLDRTRAETAANDELIAEMDRRFGDKSIAEIEKEITRLDGEIAGLQKAGSREFDGNVGRRTAPAVSSEGARLAGEEKLRLGIYLASRTPAPASSPDTSATPADKAIYGMVAEGKSADDVLAFIGKASRRPFNRYLANALRNLGVRPALEVGMQGVPRAVRLEVIGRNAALPQKAAEGNNMPAAGDSYILEQHSLLRKIDDLLNAPRNKGVTGNATNSVDGKAPPEESGINSVRLDAKTLRNIIEKQSFVKHGFSGLDVESKRAMRAAVLRSSKNLKILDSVIKLIPVDVVNMLRTKQLTPEMILHNPAMLQRAISVNLGFDIPTGTYVSSSLARAAALGAAIESSGRTFSDMYGFAVNGFPADSAINSSHATHYTRQGKPIKYAAQYNPKNDTVTLFTPRSAESHALHEFVHAATLKAIAAGGPASVQMRGLFLYLKRNGSLAGQYGMSNLDEFVAEAFSNPKFQQALKAIPAPKGSTLKNAWEWFVRAVRTALGLKSPAMETALDRAMVEGAKLMRENAALTGAAGGGVRGSFVGESAATANNLSLRLAKKKIDGGADAEQVRQQTGWFKGSDKKWRFEINDADASLMNLRMEDGRALVATSLDDILDHPSLFAAYPGLADIDVQITIKPDAATSGKYKDGYAKGRSHSGNPPEIIVSAKTEKDALSTLLHEIQHGIQSVEGFATGGNPMVISSQMTDSSKTLAEAGSALNSAMSEVRANEGVQAYREILAAVRNDGYRYSHIAFVMGKMDDDAVDVAMIVGELAKKKGYKALAEAADAYSVIAENIINPGQVIDREKAAYNKYLRLAGEVESRNVEARAGMTDEQRRTTSPESTQDVPSSDVIVVFNGKEAKSAPMPANAMDDTIAIDGIERSRTNSDGKPIAATDDGIRNFWRWFAGSAVTDDRGRPLVVYHGSPDLRFLKDEAVFKSQKDRSGFGRYDAAHWFSADMRTARSYADPRRAFDYQNSEEGTVDAYIRIENPLVVNAGGQEWRTAQKRGKTSDVIEEARAAGNDGVIINSVKDDYNNGNATRPTRTFTVFGSAQIKSATENSGSFSPDNPDIRYNLATDWYNGPSGAPVRNAWQAAKDKAAEVLTPKRLDKIIYELQDKYVDLKNLRAHIKEIGGAITDMNDAYLGEELYHKRLAHRTERFQENELLPLLEEAKAKGVSKEELETFLHARHAPEANAAMAKRNPNQAEIDAGRLRAKAMVRGLELRLQRAEATGSSTAALSKALNTARGELMGWNSAQAFRGTEDERTSLSGMSDADADALMNGLAPARLADLDSLAAKVDAINAGTLDLLDGYGLMSKDALTEWRKAYQHYVPLHRDEAHPDSLSHPIGQGFSTKGDAAKRRTGSNQKVTNILGHIAMQREAALTRGEKNRVMLKLYLMARQNPLPEVWKVGSVEMLDTIDKATGFVRSIPDPLHKNRPNVLVLRVAGKDVAITFNEHNPEALRMAHALKNLDVDDLHYLIPVVGKVTRWFASINTQYNPIFGIVNLLRDTQEAALNLSTTELSGKQGEILKDQMSILKEVLKNKGRMPRTGPWAALFAEFNEIGGSTGYRDLFLDAADRSKALQDTIDKLDQGKAGKAWDMVKDWLSDYNEAMENSTRLAAYKAALDTGMSKERAASLAKNLTVNFNRKGRQTRELGALYAFFNAAVQGTTRMAQTLKGPAGRKIMAGGVMLGAMNAMIGIAIMGGDDDEGDEWEKIPEFIREKSIIIPISKSDYISIPMPLGFQFLPNIGRLSVEMAHYKDKTAGTQMASLFNVLAGAFDPFGGSAPPMQIVAPTVLDPFVALAQNRDWTGKPIFIENRNSLDPSPGASRSKESATPWAKWFAETINSATGGTEYTPGGWSPTPDQIDYVIGQLTGGVGREAGKIASTATAPFTGEELPPHKIPLAGRFYGNTEGHSGQSEKFYANITRANEVENEIKGRVKAGESPAEYMKENPGAAALAARGNAAERQVAKLRKFRREIAAKDAPGSMAKVKSLNERIAVVMTRFNMDVARAQK